MSTHPSSGFVPARQVFELTRAGDRDRLAGLLADGLPVDLTTADGETLLVLAAAHAHPAVVDLLLSSGADHALADPGGRTALAAAVASGCAPAVRSLLGAGADPHHGSPSAAQTARARGLDEMTALLGA